MAYTPPEFLYLEWSLIKDAVLQFVFPMGQPELEAVVIQPGMTYQPPEANYKTKHSQELKHIGRLGVHRMSYELAHRSVVQWDTC